MIGVRFPAGAGDFSVHHRVQAGSGIHPDFYPMGGRRDLSLGIKRPSLEVDHIPPYSTEIKECGALYLHSPIRLHDAELT
jgi:hypothetical protein